MGKCRRLLDVYQFPGFSPTSSPTRPSQTDITIAMEFESYRSKLNLPKPFHLIVSLEFPDQPLTQAFRIQDSNVTEVPLHVTG